MKVIFLSVLFLATLGCFAQSFEGGVTAGLNFSQLDGDLLSGYNKPGINGGFWVRYPFNDKWSGGLEFIFTEKGATRSINEENIASTKTFDRFRLTYIEVPLYVGYTFKKFTFKAGITAAYLMRAKVNDFTGERDYKNQLKPYDFGTLWGVSYPISKHFAAQLQWQYSAFSIAKGDKRNIFNDNALSTPAILGFYNNLFSFSIKYKFGG